jgi:uncharacterized membrane protein
MTGVFALIYASISLVNHYLFKTAALDLGLYTNALYDYAHFRFNDSLGFKVNPENLLSDHFDLMLMLASPFSWIFGSYTLLLLQIFSILIGGWGIYYFLKAKGNSDSFAFYGTMFFYLYFSIYSALSFDYHSKVVAASLLPWFFYFIEKKNILKSILLFFLIIICQESMGLWMGFVTLGAVYIWRKEKSVKTLLALSAASFVYFFIITSIVMPALSETNTFYQFRYSILGKNYWEAFQTIFSEPGKIFHALFFNTSGDPMGDYVKSECWLFFLFSGGLLLLFRPIWLFMLIPIFLQKFLHNQVSMWGVNDQYVIEFAPVVTLGVMDCIKSFTNPTIRKTVMTLSILSGIGTTVHLMDRTSALIPKSKVRLYQSAHWKSEINLQRAKEAIALIPKEAILSAQSNIYPHLAWRDKCYAFPEVKDAEYILFVKGGNPYPINENLYKFLTDSFTQSKAWKIIYNSESINVLRKK